MADQRAINSQLLPIITIRGWLNFNHNPCTPEKWTHIIVHVPSLSLKFIFPLSPVHQSASNQSHGVWFERSTLLFDIFSKSVRLPCVDFYFFIAYRSPSNKHNSVSTYCYALCRLNWLLALDNQHCSPLTPLLYSIRKATGKLIYQRIAAPSLLNKAGRQSLIMGFEGEAADGRAGGACGTVHSRVFQRRQSN